jgi:hypothetical protein
MNETAPKPWHRHPLVWMLIAIPAVAVVAGFVTLWLAITSDDGLVEDDYYKRGKEINRVLERDRAAARYGLEATIVVDPASGAMTVQLLAPRLPQPPAQLEVAFLHATRSGFDQRLVLPRDSDGRYRGRVSPLAPGHWHLQLAAGDWRLIGVTEVPGPIDLHIMAAPQGR